MTVELRDFNLGDLLQVCYQLPAVERAVLEAIRGEPYNAEQSAVEAFGYEGLHWIGVANGEPIAAGGFIRQRSRVFRTWFYATDRAWSEHGAALTSLVADVIKQMLHENAHRIETITLASHRRARAWYERIGLKHETTLRGYCANGESAVSYVAVKTPENI